MTTKIILEGVPDASKRSVILKHFSLSETQCEQNYASARKLAGEQTWQNALNSRIAQKNVAYNFLTEEGKCELEFILMYLHKKHSLQVARSLP